MRDSRCVSASRINATVEEAVAAMEAGDWSTAIRKLMAAQARLAAKPDSTSGMSGLRWDRASITRLLAECRRMQTSAATASSGGIRRSAIEYEDG